MSEVDVVLNGRSYPVLCGEGEEDRVREVARFVDARLAQVRLAAPQASEAQLLVLVSLIIGDELLDAKAAASPPVSGNGSAAGDDEAVAEAIAALADRVEALVGRVDRA